MPDLASIYVLDIDPTLDMGDAARRYAASPSILYASPDYEVHATLIPNDPFFSTSGTWGQSYDDPWGLHRTNAAAAWDTARGAGTVIAVLDTGVDFTHPTCRRTSEPTRRRCRETALTTTATASLMTCGAGISSVKTTTRATRTATKLM